MIPSTTRRGRSRRRKSPARAITNVYATSQVRVNAEKSAPSASRAKNAPSGATTNWGSTLGKNAAIFGLPRLLSSPCRSATEGRRRAPPELAWDAGGPDLRSAAMSTCAPMKMRYAAPSSRSARNAGSEARRSAAAPTLVTTAQVSCPRLTPIAVATPPGRPPNSVLRIVRAVSWPGVTITRMATARNSGSWSTTTRAPRRRRADRRPSRELHTDVEGRRVAGAILGHRQGQLVVAAPKDVVSAVAQPALAFRRVRGLGVDPIGERVVEEELRGERPRAGGRG